MCRYPSASLVKSPDAAPIDACTVTSDIVSTVKRRRLARMVDPRPIDISPALNSGFSIVRAVRWATPSAYHPR